MSPNVKESDSGDDLQDQIATQLRMIEVSHDMTITNLTSIARIIIANVKTRTKHCRSVRQSIHGLLLTECKETSPCPNLWSENMLEK